VSGSPTLLGSYTQALTTDQEYLLELRCIGTTISLLVDGVSRISVTDSSNDGTGSGNRVGFRCSTGIASNTIVFKDWGVDDLAASNTIGFTDVANHRIFQRSGASKSISLAGTYAGEVPASIEVRTVKQSDGTPVQNWANVGATIGAGTWSASIAVNAGPDMLLIQVRSKTAGDAVLATANGANQFGVGDVFQMVGSSTLENWFVSGAGALTSQARVRAAGGTWSAMSTVGAGAIAFANAHGASSGYVVGFIRSGVSGTRLRASFPGWASPANADFLAAVAAHLAAGACAVLSAVGVNDASDSAIPSEAAHLAEHRALIANYRGASVGVNNPTLPWIVLTSNRRTTVNDPYFDRCRAAEMTLAGDANVYVSASVLDQPLNGDGIHLSDAGYGVQGARAAAAVAVAVLGSSTSHRGPTATSAQHTDALRTAIDVSLTHGRGSDITPSSGITGWTIVDGGTPPTIIAVTRQAADKIRLALSAAPTGTATITYQGGTNPTVSAPVIDNSDLILPMSPTPGSFALVVANAPAPATNTGLRHGRQRGRGRGHR
jgi:lysophospholipase L1-like esterase